jgi:hypothetical protein
MTDSHAEPADKTRSNAEDGNERLGDAHGMTELIAVVQVSGLVLEDDQLVLDEVVETQCIDGGYAQWECDCGETFGRLGCAEEHMREVAE